VEQAEEAGARSCFFLFFLLLPAPQEEEVEVGSRKEKKMQTKE